MAAYHMGRPTSTSRRCYVASLAVADIHSPPAVGATGCCRRGILRGCHGRVAMVCSGRLFARAASVNVPSVLPSRLGRGLPYLRLAHGYHDCVVIIVNGRLPGGLPTSTLRVFITFLAVASMYILATFGATWCCACVLLYGCHNSAWTVCTCMSSLGGKTSTSRHSRLHTLSGVHITWPRRHRRWNRLLPSKRKWLPLLQCN